MRDHDRLAKYVNRYFARKQKTEFPTVSRCARSLRWRYDRVIDAVEGDPNANLFLTSYYCTPEPTLGEHFVEAYE